MNFDARRRRYSHICAFLSVFVSYDLAANQWTTPITFQQNPSWCSHMHPTDRPALGLLTPLDHASVSHNLKHKRINAQYRIDACITQTIQTHIAHLRKISYPSNHRNRPCGVKKAKNGPPSTVFKLFLSLSFFALNKSRAHFCSEHGYRARERQHHYQKNVRREICRPWTLRHRESAH